MVVTVNASTEKRNPQEFCHVHRMLICRVEQGGSGINHIPLSVPRPVVKQNTSTRWGNVHINIGKIV